MPRDITPRDVQVVYINAHSHRELSPVDVDPCTPAYGVLSLIQPGKLYLITPHFPSKGRNSYTLPGPPNLHSLTVDALPTTCHGVVEICMTVCRFSTGLQNHDHGAGEDDGV